MKVIRVPQPKDSWEDNPCYDCCFGVDGECNAPQEIIDSDEECGFSWNTPNYVYKQVEDGKGERQMKTLEQAAEEYADKHGFRVPYDSSDKYYDDVDVKASLEGFKAGAEWMAKQGVSYETELGWEIDGDRAFPKLDPPVEDLLMPSDISLNFNDGDKVIVQIRKAE